MDNNKTQSSPPEYGAATGSVLDDAVKCAISMRGQALLQWGFRNGFADHSVQMPEAVIDQIIAWRDETQN